MNNMKIFKYLLLNLLATLFFTACEKDETPKLLSISGEVLVQDAITPEITSPLENITVYLLNSPFTIDTTALWFTRTNVLDSTKTDANGLYKFSRLQAENYEVMPIDTVTGYIFEKSVNSDNTISSDNSQLDYTLNFTAPEIVAENSPSTYTFQFNNSGDHPNCYIYIHQESRSRFCGMWWGKWEYNSVGGIDTETLSDVNTYITKEENTYSHEYRNKFKIEFGCFYIDYRSVTNSAPKTFLMYTVDDLKLNNVIDVEWTPYTAKVN